MKKIAKSLMAVMVLLVGLSGIYASSNVGILDTEYTDTIYKFSDNAEINLPFVRISSARMIMDKDVNKSGISFSNESLSVLNILKGVQTLISSDTIRITGNIEYGIVIAPTVIIEGTVEKSMIIVAGNVTISENAVVKEDLLCSVSKLELYGKIEGNLLGTIEQVDVYGNISKDFRANIGSITLNEKSKIDGNIYITSYNKIDISDKYPNATVKIMQEVNDVYKIDIWNISKISIAFALIYLLISAKTNVIKNALNKIKTYKISTITFGFVCIIAIPILFIPLVILSLIGLGVISFSITIIYTSFILLTFILSKLIIGSLMSEYIINKYNEKIKGNWYKLILTFVLFIILNVITDLPTIGHTISLALCILSTGIVFTTLFRKIK